VQGRMQKTKDAAGIAAGVILLACALSAQAYTINLSPRSPRTIYLQVGVGAFNGGTYNQGGSPAVNGTINVVSVTVPAARVRPSRWDCSRRCSTRTSRHRTRPREASPAARR